jgi:hypothetical protein
VNPSVGRIVHIATPDLYRCYAAMVTEVDRRHPERIGATVFMEYKMDHHPLELGGFDLDDRGLQRVGGTWHWPERTGDPEI